MGHPSLVLSIDKTSSALEVPGLIRYNSLSPRRLLSCPSPIPLSQHLHNVVTNWERLVDHAVASTDASDHIVPDNDPDEPSASSTVIPCLGILNEYPRRRMTVPSMHVPDCNTRRHVVTLDPMYGASLTKTDLDDISQPENGLAGDAEITASDTDSEGSGKEEENDQIEETPYVANENEVLGSVRNFVVNCHVTLNSL